MKRHLVATALLSAALLCGFAFTTPASQDPSAARIEKLEKDLAASRLRVEALSTDVADLKKQMAATLQYLQVQAKSAGAMAGVLDESENLGFTYGINPNSRHTLLRGWHEQLAAAQKDVPAAELPPVIPTAPKTDGKNAKPAGAEKAPGN